MYKLLSLATQNSEKVTGSNFGQFLILKYSHKPNRATITPISFRTTSTLDLYIINALFSLLAKEKILPSLQQKGRQNTVFSVLFYVFFCYVSCMVIRIHQFCDNRICNIMKKKKEKKERR